MLTNFQDYFFGELGILLLIFLFSLSLVFIRNHYQAQITQSKEEALRLMDLLGLSRQEIGEKDQRLTEVQQLYVHEKTCRATAEERNSRLLPLEEQLKSITNEVTHLRTQNASLISNLENEKKQSIEKMQAIDQAQARLTDAFRRLSSDALSANNQSFLQLANTALQKFQDTARMDLGQRQQAIVEMMQPMHQALTKVDHKILELEKQRVGAYEVLRQQVLELVSSQKELRLETSNLVKALRAPTVRGQWGEIQLKRVVEMAGMLSYCDFIEQVSTAVDGGRIRPDMIVNLPGDKKIIVDAKAPLAAYLEALEAKDDTIRQQKIQDHARQVRQHIRNLSQRNYWEQFDETPEFVILFLPGETFFSAALEGDPSLIEAGVKEKVILATPTTLIALLRAIAYGWRQESLAESTRAIGELGKELYKRISDMGDHFSRLGRHLTQSVDCYNQTLGTLERRVLVSARKFKDLDSANSATLEELTPVDALPRSIQSLELNGTGLLSGNESAPEAATPIDPVKEETRVAV